MSFIGLLYPLASTESDHQAHPASTIAKAIDDFMGSESRVTRVISAHGPLTPPQPLAYVVHFPRLSVTLNGTDSMWLEKQGRAHLLHVKKGEAVLIPAHRWNRPASVKPSTTLNLLFGRRQIGVSLVTYHRTKRAEPSALKATLPEQSEQAIRHLIQGLLILDSISTQAATPLVEAILRCVQEALLAPVPSPKRRATGVYEEICMYIQENFSFPLSRDSVAAHFRLSPNHVSRLFKREGMVAFNDYVNYVRINRAKYLLKTHRQTVDEIGAACGFSEASYFCRVFKKKTRLTPGGYREASQGTAALT